MVGGGSAGGNLAAALMLRARDEGLPLPVALILLTPEADLTESGDSFQTNLGIDCVLTESLADSIALYAGDHDLRHPYLSPLFGDLTAPFPADLSASWNSRPVFVQYRSDAPEASCRRGRCSTPRVRGHAPRRVLRCP